MILDLQCKEQLNNYYFKRIKHFLFLKIEKQQLHEDMITIINYALFMICDLKLQIEDL